MWGQKVLKKINKLINKQMIINNLSIYANYIYYITMLFLIYNIYIKFIDLSKVISHKKFNVKIVKNIFNFAVFCFVTYFLFDSYSCYLNYEKYTNNLTNKLIKLFLGFVLLILKLIINKINSGPENKIDWSSLLKFSMAIVCPLIIPFFIDYIMIYEEKLDLFFKSLIGCVQLLGIFSLLVAMVPTLLECNFVDYRIDSKLLSRLGNNIINKGGSFNINIVDNTINPADNNSNVNPVSRPPINPESRTEGRSSSILGAESNKSPQSEASSSSSDSSDSEETSGNKRRLPEASQERRTYKRPNLKNYVVFDTDSDTKQTSNITYTRRSNRWYWEWLEGYYDTHASNNPDFPTDEYYESTRQSIRDFIDHRNTKTDGKITPWEINQLSSRRGWDKWSYDDLCKKSNDVDFELTEHRKNLKGAKDDLWESIIEKNKTKNIKEKEEYTKAINRYIKTIKRYKETELQMRKEQLALNYRKADIILPPNNNTLPERNYED
jgi:hypothetical protein